MDDPKRPLVEVYQDEDYTWRWRLIAEDGSEVPGSAGGCSTLDEAKRMAAEQHPGVHIEVIPWHLP